MYYRNYLRGCEPRVFLNAPRRHASHRTPASAAAARYLLWTNSNGIKHCYSKCVSTSMQAPSASYGGSSSSSSDAASHHFSADGTPSTPPSLHSSRIHPQQERGALTGDDSNSRQQQRIQSIIQQKAPLPAQINQPYQYLPSHLLS